MAATDLMGYGAQIADEVETFPSATLEGAQCDHGGDLTEGTRSRRFRGALTSPAGASRVGGGRAGWRGSPADGRPRCGTKSSSRWWNFLLTADAVSRATQSRCRSCIAVLRRRINGALPGECSVTGAGWVSRVAQHNTLPEAVRAGPCGRHAPRTAGRPAVGTKTGHTRVRQWFCLVETSAAHGGKCVTKFTLLQYSSKNLFHLGPRASAYTAGICTHPCAECEALRGPCLAASELRRPRRGTGGSRRRGVRTAPFRIARFGLEVFAHISDQPGHPCHPRGA